MAPSGKRDEEEATEHANTERQDVDELLGLPAGRGATQARDDVPVPGGDDPEDGGGQRGVHEVDEGEPVPAASRRRRQRRRVGRVVDEPEPGPRGDAVVDVAVVRGFQGVGEARQRAGEREDGEEAAGEERRRRVAGAVVGEGRGQEVEGQESAGGEQVREVRCGGERLGQRRRRLRRRWRGCLAGGGGGGGLVLLLLLFVLEDDRLLLLTVTCWRRGGRWPLPDRGGGGRRCHIRRQAGQGEQQEHDDVDDARNATRSSLLCLLLLFVRNEFDSWMDEQINKERGCGMRQGKEYAYACGGRDCCAASCIPCVCVYEMGYIYVGASRTHDAS